MKCFVISYQVHNHARMHSQSHTLAQPYTHTHTPTDSPYESLNHSIGWIVCPQLCEMLDVITYAFESRSNRKLGELAFYTSQSDRTAECLGFAARIPASSSASSCVLRCGGGGNAFVCVRCVRWRSSCCHAHQRTV